MAPQPEFYYIILAILGSLGVLFNGVLLIVLWRNKTPEFRLGTSYVIGNLALSDCLTGIAVLLYVARLDFMTKYQLSMVWATVEASLMSLMFLSVERILAFHYPFASKTLVTVKRTIYFIVFIWIFALTCGVFVYFHTLMTQLIMTILFEVCVVVFLLSQSYIILKMQQRKRRNIHCDHDVSIITRKRMHQQRLNNHVTKVVLILIVVVVVTLLPYMVALQIYLLSAVQLRPPLDKKTEEVVVTFITYFYPVELLNFIVNPIIYAYRLERYRRAFFKTFSFLNCGPFVKQQTRHYSETSGDDHKEFKQSLKMTKLIMD